MYKQIGNAVPVLLAEKIADKIKIELDKYEKSNREANRTIKDNRINRAEVFE
jgi:hypothetical protein